MGFSTYCYVCKRITEHVDQGNKIKCKSCGTVSNEALSNLITAIAEWFFRL